MIETKKLIGITEGTTYIFIGTKPLSRKEYSKFKILEITDTTYLVKNIDADITFRVGKEDFNIYYEPVEIIEYTTINDDDGIRCKV